MKAWRDLTFDEQAALTRVSAQLGLGLMPIAPEAAQAVGVNLAQGFVEGQVFNRGTLYFDPAVATVDDLTHDLGHALALSPAQRAAFHHPEGDLETGEAAAMLGQWAIARAALPAYDLAASMADFGYHFGYADHSFEGLTGEQWAHNLSMGRVVREELALYCHFQAEGLVSALPCLRPPQKKADWEMGPDWLPTWAELTYASEIAAARPIATPKAVVARPRLRR